MKKILIISGIVVVIMIIIYVIIKRNKKYWLIPKRKKGQARLYKIQQWEIEACEQKLRSVFYDKNLENTETQSLQVF